MESNISLSVIDYIPEISRGVALILSLKIDLNLYELIYWFDQENNVKIIPEEKFLVDLEIDDIYSDPGIVGFVEYIEKNIPPKSEILKQFKKV